MISLLRNMVWKLKASVFMVKSKVRFEISLAKLKFWAWWLTLDWLTINVCLAACVFALGAVAFIVAFYVGIWKLFC